MSKILFVDATDHYDPTQRTSRPTGGILNSLTLIPEYLAKKGHEVYVNSMFGKDAVVNGVNYVTSGKTIGKWDVAVFNRNVLPKEFVDYSHSIGAKVMWWLHDIVQTTYLKDDTFTKCDRIIALSEYCKKTYSDFYGINPDKFSVISNGVDPSLFYPGDVSQRNKNIVITASAPVKGFLPIPTVYENLKCYNDDIDFRIYSNQSLHYSKNTAAQQEYLDSMERQGAHVYSPVSQEALGHLLRQARCLLMPNSYPEICSNLLLQAQACGCPVVTSNIGANPEFIENGVTGLYTHRYLPHDLFSWIIEYTNLVLDVCGSDTLFTRISTESPKAVKTWDQIGEEWNNVINQLVQK